MYLHVYIYIYIYIHTYIHTYTYIYIYMCIHTLILTYIYIYICVQMSLMLNMATLHTLSAALETEKRLSSGEDFRDLLNLFFLLARAFQIAVGFQPSWLQLEENGAFETMRQLKRQKRKAGNGKEQARRQDSQTVERQNGERKTTKAEGTTILSCTRRWAARPRGGTHSLGTQKLYQMSLLFRIIWYWLYHGVLCHMILYHMILYYIRLD